MKPYKLAKSGSSRLAACLDQIRMSPGERPMARVHLHQAELLADRLMRVYADRRLVLGFPRPGVGAFARHSQLPGVMPEPN